MSILLSILIGLVIVLAVLLTLVVLAQNPKGGGLSSAFGGAGSSQLMGVKRTNDLLEKVTWGFAIAIMVLCISSGFIVNNSTPQADIPSSVNIERAGDLQAPALPEVGDSTAFGGGAEGSDVAPAESSDEGDTTNPF
ncbi:preprotein translocase subunit SecG [Catalinimonas alkaloidigena]|uniref:Protein-export membrane protein SecG n=1 Tax=Catalinimonas alkaloidigena TaxID=1075417 RepID=A0A1G8XTQ8_9BACT|nr:preprotein translocase subunit SecG [Catalinimonas alkaloidigena]SDJ94012.1 preprotein translocase subunit SecG [Catalinimonas alkaloidigena]